MGERRKSRTVAFQTLYAWEMNPQESSDALDQILESEEIESFSEENLNWIRLLIAGTIQELENIDESISGHLKNWDFKRLSRVDLAILRISVYQIFYMDDIPDTVAINEAVELGKKYGSDGSYRFINGVLDGIIKEKSGDRT